MDSGENFLIDVITSPQDPMDAKATEKGVTLATSAEQFLHMSVLGCSGTAAFKYTQNR